MPAEAESTLLQRWAQRACVTTSKDAAVASRRLVRITYQAKTEFLKTELCGHTDIPDKSDRPRWSGQWSQGPQTPHAMPLEEPEEAQVLSRTV